MKRVLLRSEEAILFQVDGKLVGWVGAKEWFGGISVLVW